jgi:hypothetical protein
MIRLFLKDRKLHYMSAPDTRSPPAAAARSERSPAMGERLRAGLAAVGEWASWSRDERPVEMVISPNMRLCLPGNQQIKFGPSLGGRPVMVWPTSAASTSCFAGEL